MDAMKLGETLWLMHLENMRALDQIVEKSRTRGESGVLLYLYHVNRPMFSGELTEKMGLTSGRIANILKGLESSGLVARTPDAQDKRRVQVALTPAGEAIAQQKNQDAIAFHAQLLSRLEEGEAQYFLDICARMGAVIDENGHIREG